MPDDTLMAIGSILFTAGSITFIALGIFSGVLGPGTGLPALISGGCAVAGIFVVLVGGLRDGDRSRVVYVRRVQVPAVMTTPESPVFCAECGSPLRAGAGGLACPACGART